MDSKENSKIDIKSLYEIMQDNFFIVLLGAITDKFRNLEAKNFIKGFISELSPVFIYEAYLWLKRTNLIEDEKFFRNKELKNKVTKYRMVTTKKEVKQSKDIKHITEKMGITFSEDIYDINVISSEDSILGFNFYEYNKREDIDFFGGCYLTNLDFVKSTLKFIINMSELDYYNIINTILIEKDKELKILEKNLSGNRYSYKSSKIFKNSNIQESDKLFILYRYNILKTIIEIQKFFDASSITIKINDKLVIDSNRFFGKAMALEITDLGNDIQSIDTPFMKELKNNLDEKILKLNSNFYPLNRMLRNNIHYTKIEEINDKYKEIKNIQLEYIKFVYNQIQEKIYFELDENDIIMNEFFKYCDENGIKNEEIEQNYEDYYTQYYCKKYIDRNE